MTIKASKFTKFKNKINRKLIGSYGSDTGLGTDLVVKKYSVVLDSYNERTLTYVSQETCKGIIINSNDYTLSYQQGLTLNENEVRILIPIEIEIIDTKTHVYQFILNSKTYTIKPTHNAIGQVSNLEGVVRELVLTPID